MLQLLAGLASSGLAVHNATKGSPETPKSIRSLNSAEKRLYNRAAQEAVKQYSDARGGKMSTQNKAYISAFKSKSDINSRQMNRDILLGLSNPDTMLGTYNIIQSSNRSLGTISNTMESVSGRASAMNTEMKSANESISQADAVRRGYIMQRAQDKAIDQINRANRQTLLGQGIGSAISSVGQYYAQKQIMESVARSDGRSGATTPSSQGSGQSSSQTTGQSEYKG